MLASSAILAGAARYGFAVSNLRPHGWALRCVVRPVEDRESTSTYGLIYLGGDGRTYLYARDGAGYLSVPIERTDP